MAPPKSKKLYQLWGGNNKFCCGGRLIFGPDAISLCLTTLLIAGPAVTFCVRMGLMIRGHYPYGYIVFTLGVVLTTLVIIFLFCTASSDPGIVPRNSIPIESDDIFDKSSLSIEWVSGKTSDLKLPKTRNVAVNGHFVRVKYCETCFLYRPPRASHCSICNNCVQRFDHHCPWVGQCIGVRNYWYFMLFISLTTCLCIYIFVFSWINLLHQQGGLWSIMAQDILSVVMIVYCFIAVWFVGGLTIFHLYLICTNQTTYENFRYRYDKKENPYNKGIFVNLKEFILTKIPPSTVHFRDFIEEGIKSTGSRKATTKSVGSRDKRKCNSMGILENLDYSGIEDVKGKRKVGEIDMTFEFDHPFFPSADDDQHTERRLESVVGSSSSHEGNSSPFLI